MSSARPLLATGLSCLMLALAAGASLAACGSGSSSQASTTSASRADLVSILQDDGRLLLDPGGTLQQARALGVTVLRANVFWNRIAPDPLSFTRPSFDATDPAAYPASGWTVYDEVVRDAAADGIRVDFTVTGPPPLWAAGRDMPHTRNCPCSQWRPSASEFGAFVQALGSRYSGHYTPPGASAPLPRVSWWSIWNEPNYGPNLAPQATAGSTVEVSPRLYRGLLEAAWEALALTGHSTTTDTILIGETAPRGLSGPHLPGNFSGMVPLRFIRALYCVGSDFRPLQGAAATVRGCPATPSGSASFRAQNPALFDATGFADHPYPDSFPPDYVSPFDAASEPDYADYAVLGKLERTLDKAFAAYGSTIRLPIYSTEFGYKTNPPYAGGLPTAQAAAYLNQAEYLSWLNPRIRSYDQYLLADPPPATGSQFDTGLEFADGQPKPQVYAAFRIPFYMPTTRSHAGQSLQVWGCARPALAAMHAGSDEHVAIQFARSSGHFQTLLTVPLHLAGGCYFDAQVQFPGTGVARLAWRAPDGWEYSRTQDVTVS